MDVEKVVAENTDAESDKSVGDLRFKTDVSLDAERNKTDTVILRKGKAIEQEADKRTKLNRIEADKNQLQDRSAADTHPSESSGERRRADEAQGLARLDEDKVRTQERAQKRLAAEALLEAERHNTDRKLLNERAQVDRLSQANTHLLSEEKTLHDATKTALLTRDQFLSIVSHDLKDPLSTIATAGSLMRIELNKSRKKMPGLSQLLDVVETGAANMNRMISDLLDVERISSNKLELQKAPTEICTLLNECREMFLPVVKKDGFTLKVELCPAALSIDLDHDRIIQVMSNLISNALKFSGPGCTIHISAVERENEIEISVTDNGPGIDEGKLENIFDRFSQCASNDGRGLGLGLFISKWIVEAHRGKIWARSKLGEGTTFYFVLPTDLSETA